MNEIFVSLTCLVGLFFFFLSGVLRFVDWCDKTVELRVEKKKKSSQIASSSNNAGRSRNTTII